MKDQTQELLDRANTAGHLVELVAAADKEIARLERYQSINPILEVRPMVLRSEVSHLLDDDAERAIAALVLNSLRARRAALLAELAALCPAPQS